MQASGLVSTSPVLKKGTINISESIFDPSYKMDHCVRVLGLSPPCKKVTHLQMAETAFLKNVHRLSEARTMTLSVLMP